MASEKIEMPDEDRELFAEFMAWRKKSRRRRQRLPKLWGPKPLSIVDTFYEYLRVSDRLRELATLLEGYFVAEMIKNIKVREGFCDD